MSFEGFSYVQEIWHGKVTLWDSVTSSYHEYDIDPTNAVQGNKAQAVAEVGRVIKTITGTGGDFEGMEVIRAVIYPVTELLP